MALHTSQKEIAQVLSIPPSTLQRRKKSGQLQTDESDRVVRLASLKDATVAMMQGDDEAAVAWLRTPLDILGGESPLEHASTELGARDVEDLIGRLRHGVFS
jgi:putative toxin-antitoxin system antitoxin component (TIGR02293 family)